MEFLRFLIFAGAMLLLVGMFEGRIANRIAKLKKQVPKFPAPPDTECPIHHLWVAPHKECPECGWVRPD
jgi:hypothetical protein